MRDSDHRNAGIEYRFLKFDTHNKAETALNEWVADGWQLVTYQAAGESVITHFLLLSRGLDNNADASPEGLDRLVKTLSDIPGSYFSAR